MTRTHPGRPGTKIIPTDWEARLAPVAAKLQTGQCTVRGPATHGPPDEGTGVRSTVAGTVRYTGACRVQRRNQIYSGDTRAEQLIQSATYLISIDYTASAVQPDDTVTITTSNDPRLLSGVFTVVEVVEGSMRWQRDLWCKRDS